MTPHHLQMLYGIAMNIGEKDIDSAKYYQEPPKSLFFYIIIYFYCFSVCMFY